MKASPREFLTLGSLRHTDLEEPDVGFETEKPNIQIQALSHTSCVTLAVLFSLSEFLFPPV